MNPARNLLRRFARDEAGAVTVEYVVLAAAITGMALGSADVINRGLAALSGTIDSELSEDASGGRGALAYEDGFDNGAAGWSGAAAASIPGFGNVLGPIKGSGGVQSLTRDFALAANGAAATFTFDVISGDSLDDESGIIFIDGVEVGRVTSHWRNGTVFTAAEGLAARGITIDATVIDEKVQIGGNESRPEWSDARTSISISVANPKDKPKDKLKFGFGSTADQDVNDEFFAIDNFKASGLRDPSAPAA